MRKISALIPIIITLAGCVSSPTYIQPVTPIAQNIPGLYYRVRPGDTLWKISRAYGIEIDDILKANHLTESSVVEVGQPIFIPSQSRPGALPVKYYAEDFIWPIKGKVIAPFGVNFHNLLNNGLNIQPYSDTNVLASHGGKVVFCAHDFGNFGRVIIIDHGNGLRTLYARNAELFVKAGDSVKKGAIIARVGQAGRDKASYLHFEVRKGGESRNPLFYLP